MSKRFNKSSLNQIPQRNKDLTFGYVHEYEKKNNAIMPEMIKYLSLVYLNQNKDKVNTKSHYIDINGDTIVCRNSFAENSCQCLTFANLVNKGTHIWKFKYKLYNDFIGWQNDKHYVQIGIIPHMNSHIYNVDLEGHFMGSTGYGIRSTGLISDFENPSDHKPTIQFGYGPGFGIGDIIEMKADFDKMMLFFKNNHTDYKKACDIDQYKYRAAIYFKAHDGEITLISYQHIN